jgi:hypothetical protein
VKKFEGKMVTLLYEEKLTNSQSHPTAPHTLTTGISKNAPTATLSEKENNGPVVLTTSKLPLI